jgi:hypothetical protein
VQRLKRLHRAAAQQLKQFGAEALLTCSQERHWAAACRDKLVEVSPNRQLDAVALASAAVDKAQQKQQLADDAAWRRKFATWTAATITTAAPELRPPVAAATFSAEDMRDSWRQYWRPLSTSHGDGEAKAQAWSEYAARSGLAVSSGTWKPPTEKQFLEALKGVRDAAGLDGWKREELTALRQQTPWLASELYRLLVRTTEEAAGGLPSRVLEQLYAWRIVGIPKRKSDEARPIAIASCIARAWHKALLPLLPSAPEGQSVVWQERRQRCRRNC